MKTDFLRAVSLLTLSFVFAITARAAEPAAKPVRVLLIAGGHEFETNQFLKLFSDNPAITFQFFLHPQAHAQLRPDAAKKYDVLVLYDFWQPVTDEAKADLIAWLQAGKGLVGLHHSIANYQKWPEYERIIGGRYYLAPTKVNGVEKPQSTWQHDVDFNIHLADPAHPVTAGLADFRIHDETYGLFDMAAGSHALLTTDAPTSAKNIGWANRYGEARVVYLQLGHDHQAYENPNYRRLVAQAIRWVAPYK